jgi:hypothetical protein
MLVSAKVAARPPAQRPETSFFILMISHKGDFPCDENGPCRQWFRRLLTNNRAGHGLDGRRPRRSPSAATCVLNAARLERVFRSQPSRHRSSKDNPCPDSQDGSNSQHRTPEVERPLSSFPPSQADVLLPAPFETFRIDAGSTKGDGDCPAPFWVCFSRTLFSLVR